MRNILIVLGLAGVSLAAFAAKPQPQDAASPEFYTAQVQPILQKNCYQCHAGEAHRGGLSIDTRAALLKGGNDGPAIVPGDPDKSLLIQLVGHNGMLAGMPMTMPPGQRTKLTDAEVDTLKQWVKAGAVMP
jgi:mono/diheme cytochrome c family protein